MVDQRLIGKINYGLGFLYLIILLFATIQFILKVIKERTLSKTSVVFPLEIACHALVRSAYFLNPIGNWGKILGLEFGTSYMVIIDLLPEVMFLSIYLLLVATWIEVWNKAHKLKPYNSRRFWTSYWIPILVLFVAIFIISFLCAINVIKSYQNALFWESVYLTIVSGFSVVAAIYFGARFYSTVLHSYILSTRVENTVRHFMVLVIITSFCFIAKAAWTFSVSNTVREKWEHGAWSSTSFGIFWFSYYLFTEIVEEFAVLIVLAIGFSERVGASSAQVSHNNNNNNNNKTPTTTKQSYNETKPLIKPTQSINTTPTNV